MIVRVTGLLLALLVLLGVILYGALASPAGNRLLVRLAEDALQPALSVKGVSGSVLSDLCADEVGFRADGVQVRMETVCVNPRLWSSVDFLKIDLEAVQAASIEILIEADSSGEEPEAPASLNLPVDIVVDRLALDRLVINGFLLEKVRVAADLSNDDLSLAGEVIYESTPVEFVTGGGWSDLQLGVQAYGVNLDAELDLIAEGLPWQAAVRADVLDLAEFVDRPTELRSLAMEGSGNLDSYRFEATGSVEDDVGSAAYSIGGMGDLNGLELDHLDLTYVVLDDLPVQVDVLRSSGTLNWSDGFRLELVEPRLVGSLNDREVRAVAERVVLTGADVSFLSVDTEIGESAKVELSGSADFDGDLDLALAARSFPLVIADERLDGLADLRMEIAGSLTAPYLSGEAEVLALSWAEEAIGNLELQGRGSLKAGSGQVALSSESGTAEFSLGYQQIETGFEVRVEDASADFALLDARARLAEPVSVIAGEDRLKVDQACIALSSDRLDAEPGRLCADVDYPGGGLRLALEPWTLPRLPLPDSDVSVLGQMSLTVDVSQFAPLDGTAQVALTDLVAQHPDLDPLQLGNLDATVAISAERLKATLSSPAGQAQELLLNGALESTLTEEPLDSEIAGSVYMELDGIWVAQSLLPMDVAYELENVRGRMAVNAVVSGTVRDPLIDGSLKLSDAGWQVLALNADFHELEALATLRGSERIEFNSTTSVGGGRLSLAGGIAGLDTDAPSLVTTVSLQGAELVDLPDYKAAVDGEISLEMGTESLAVDGSVHLPRASIVIAELPETAVTASADELIVDEVQVQSAQQVRTTDLTLTLGDEVYLEAFGLSGRLTGNLRVQEAPGRLRSVTGVIGLNDARFEAYGQELRVERGQLTFTGPVDDPAVDVVATRIVDYDEREYRISLLITGTANDLQTEVRSQPSLPEDDALALLITGRTFSQITSNEQSNVSGAALSMGLLSATGVTQNLADTLNLEEIIVDQDLDGNMEVGAAVRLNRNLYLRYTYGVFSRLGGVLLRYRFSKRFSVQAKTGDAHSIEIRYGVDE